METQPAPVNLTAKIRQHAGEVGFQSVGVCDASPSSIGQFQEWLERGYAGEMDYLAGRMDAYADMNLVLDGVRSIVVLTLPYRTSEPVEPRAGEGRVARYAWGTADYHDIIHSKLKLLQKRIAERYPEVKTRGVVDTAPVLERDLATRAGLGWIGKNTLLLQPSHGSWFFLAALLLDAELTYDTPFATDHCGTCTACLDACPTDAFPQPYVLDATRCISYLTIEHRAAIPQDLRPGIGQWLFGCDVCQDVCPWNIKDWQTAESPRDKLSEEPREKNQFEATDDGNPVNAIQWFELDEQQWRERFRKTPLWRAKRRGLLRNAAIVLGNQPPSDAASTVLRKHLNDPESVIRGAVAWALRNNKTTAVRDALAAQLALELDADVRRELESAMGNA